MKFKNQSPRLAVWLWLSAGLGLFGCGPDCGDACRLDLTLGQDLNSHQNLALQQTAQAFVEGRSWGRGDRPRRPAALPGLQIDPDALGPDSTTDVRLGANRSLGLRHERAWGLGGQVQAYAALGAGLGRSRYALPMGMGPLADPTEIRLRHVWLQPEIGIRHSAVVPGGVIGTGAGLGLQISRTETSVQSALLDVNYRASQTMPYGALHLSVHPDSLPLTADLEARIARDGMSQIRAGLRLPLR